ncbi:MAG: type I-U CRISPR-associated protein Cas5/Cas6 [Blastopirellula sp.]|nr:MAG: type I-U CRISPR-associated protein Cas5/Cas6 [Blastopirellula sp.]
MSTMLSLSITFLDDLYHGQGDDGPEWPPSPHRVYQAILCAAARNGCDAEEEFKWFEGLAPPDIFTPHTTDSQTIEFFVPNNDADVLKKFERQSRLTSKVARPTRILGDSTTVQYLWSIRKEDQALADSIIHHARLVSAVGWGIDLVAASAEIIETKDFIPVKGTQHWVPAPSKKTLRCPANGTLQDLRNVHDSALKCISGKYYQAPRRPSVFRKVAYKSCDDVTSKHPAIIFELRNDNNKFHQYPQRKLIHLTGMVRHLAIEAMKTSPPRDVENVDEWVDRYVAGHARDYAGEHRQFSYLPLPSIGHPHADQAVRRVMISAPVGDDQWLEHLARRLAGQQLKPKRGDEFGFYEDKEKNKQPNPPPTLIRAYRDNVAACNTCKASTWASLTPVILPGHNDHKPAKTIKLIEKALRQSGIDQPCTFEWRAISWWPKSLTAHKYDKNKKLTGYIRPKHLLSQTAVHLKLQFNDGLEVPGPLVIGAGRHCGLGLMAAIDSSL